MVDAKKRREPCEADFAYGEAVSALLKKAKNLEPFEFSIIVDGLDHRADDFEDRLFQAGCHDALVGVLKGSVVLDFTREAKSFERALQAAIRDVRKAGGRAIRIEPDSLVSLSDIAERTGLTRQAVSLLVQGKRGPGDFPTPSARVTTESPLWDWVDVSRWLSRHGKLNDEEAVVRAELMRSINHGLQIERFDRVAGP